MDYTESHRIDIINGLEGRQIVNRANDLTLLHDAIDSFLDIIDKHEEATKKSKEVIV